MAVRVTVNPGAFVGCTDAQIATALQHAYDVGDAIERTQDEQAARNTNSRMRRVAGILLQTDKHEENA